MAAVADEVGVKIGVIAKGAPVRSNRYYPCPGIAQHGAIIVGAILLPTFIALAILLGVFLKSPDTPVPSRTDLVAGVDRTTAFFAHNDAALTLTSHVPKKCTYPCGITMRFSSFLGNAEVAVYIGNMENELASGFLNEDGELDVTINEGLDHFVGGCTRTQIANGRCDIYSVLQVGSGDSVSGALAINSTAILPPSATPTAKVTRSATATSTISSTATQTQTSSQSPGYSFSATATGSATATATSSYTATATSSESATHTSSATATLSASPTQSATSTLSISYTSSVTSTFTSTPSRTATVTMQPQNVVTIAGQSTTGTTDGTGTDAQFHAGTGLAVDATANVLYVADNLNKLIRRIDLSTRAVTTLAGQTGGGFTNAIGTNALFNSPHGIVLDSNGDLFITDSGNNAVRKLTVSTSAVTTFVGQTAGGLVDATGTNAKFHDPYGIAIDGSGDFYVADATNNCIRKVTSGGVVTTYAGSISSGSSDNTGTDATFYTPYAVSVDSTGNVFVADYSNYLIRKITTSRVVTTFAGDGSSGATDGTGTNAQFGAPTGLAVDLNNDNIYVADYQSNVIRKITSAGVVTTYVGKDTGDADGQGTVAQFRNPRAITVRSNGLKYVFDLNNGVVRVIN